MIKKVLIQDRFASLEHIYSLKDLLKDDINNDEIELDFVFCLNEFRDEITSYSLILSYPHVDGNCCLPIIEKALRDSIQIVFLYKSKFSHGEKIEAIAQNLDLDIVYSMSGSSREVYFNTIKKYLL